MSIVRERRLRSDHERLGTLISAHKSDLAIECARGNPPETFIVAFTASSIVEVKGNEPVLRHQHRLKIEMAADYPAIPPLVTVLGQIFHPHVWPQNNVVCLGPWKITETLETVSWSQTEAAEALHIPLSTLNQKIKRLNIDVKRKSSGSA